MNVKKRRIFFEQQQKINHQICTCEPGFQRICLPSLLSFLLSLRLSLTFLPFSSSPQTNLRLQISCSPPPPLRNQTPTQRWSSISPS
uniref:Uncharacterized protein n=1 Tax=Populus trichocarpa TaxID=3694 RepID=U5FYN1_POPTR